MLQAQELLLPRAVPSLPGTGLPPLLAAPGRSRSTGRQCGCQQLLVLQPGIGCPPAAERRGLPATIPGAVGALLMPASIGHR